MKVRGKKLIYFILSFAIIIVGLNFLIKIIFIYYLNTYINPSKYNKYKLTFSYKDYTASLFEPFKIKKIKMQNEENILNIDEVIIKPNLQNLLYFDFDNIIEKIIIRKSVFELKNIDSLIKLKNLLLAESNKEHGTAEIKIPIIIENANIKYYYNPENYIILNDINLLLKHKNLDYRINKVNLKFNEDIKFLLNKFNVHIEDNTATVYKNINFLSVSKIKGRYKNEYFTFEGNLNGGTILIEGNIKNSLIVNFNNVQLFYDYYSAFLSANLVYYVQNKYFNGSASIKKLNIGFLPMPDFDFKINYINNKYEVELHSKYGEHNLNIEMVENKPVIHIEGKKLNLDFLKKEITGLIDYKLVLDIFNKNRILNCSINTNFLKYTGYVFKGNMDFIINNDTFNCSTSKFYIDNKNAILKINGNIKDNKCFVNRFRFNDKILKNFIISYDKSEILFKNVRYEKLKNVFFNEIKFDYLNYKIFCNAILYKKYNSIFSVSIIDKNNFLLDVFDEKINNILQKDLSFKINYINKKINIQTLFSPIELNGYYDLNYNDFSVDIISNDFLNKILMSIYNKNSYSKINLNLIKRKSSIKINSKIFLSNIDKLKVFKINLNTGNNNIKIQEGILNIANSLVYFNGDYDLLQSSLGLKLNVNDFVIKNTDISGDIDLLLSLVSSQNIIGEFSSRFLKIGNFEVDDLKFKCDYNFKKKYAVLKREETKNFSVNGEVSFYDRLNLNLDLFNNNIPVGACSGNFDFENNELDIKISNDKNNVALLPVYFPLIKNSTGVGNINIHLSGKIDEPVIIGSVDFKNVNLGFASYIDELRNINGKILFDKDKINIQNITALNDKEGVIKISGEGKDIKNLKINLNAQKIKVNIKKYNCIINANVVAQLITTDTMPYLFATVEMSNGSLTYPPVYKENSKSDSVEGYFSKLYMNVKLVTKYNFSYKHEFANMFFSDNSYLIIKGSPGNFLYNGFLKSFYGDVNYLNRKFKVTDATLKFTEGDYVPILTATASANINDVDIELNYNGPILDTIKPTISSPSNPDLTQDELLQIIRVGATSDKESYEERQRDNISSVASFIDMGFMKQIMNPFKTNIEKRLGVNLDVDAPIFANIAKKTFYTDKDMANKDVNLFENTSFSVGRFLMKGLYFNYRGTLKSYEDINLNQNLLYLKSEFEAKYYLNNRATFQYIYKPEILYVPQSKPEHYFMLQYKMRY